MLFVKRVKISHLFKSSRLINTTYNNMSDRLCLFQSIGLTEQKAKETLRNEALAKKLETIVNKAKCDCEEISKPTGVLLYSLASGAIADESKINLVVRYVANKKISAVNQLNAAVEYFKHNPIEPINTESFEKSCGVNVSYTPDDIENSVEKIMKSHLDKIKEKRYRFNTGLLIGEVSKCLPWVDTKKVKSAIEMELLDILGPKTEADKTPAKKGGKGGKKESKKPAETTKPTAPQPALDLETILKLIDPKTVYLTGEAAKFHKPGDNHTTENFVVTPNTMNHLKEHTKQYGHQVRTRFPPEPNGILHIGHAKAINFNFGFAKAHDGVTFLRYDDTNPEKEEEKFFRGIRENVEWLGFKPYKVTHASDYFQELYEYAVELIKRDLAYVCHQKYEELKGHNPPPSPWRTRPIQESLQLFGDMKRGKLEEGVATLRMKIIMEDGKADPVAYRIKFKEHHRTGNKWCIYPTYDFTHCLNDSIEHITHSLCTKEFQSRRSSYYWLCNAVDVYCPVQWEYGRLNLNYAVVSKRKIAKLIENNAVADWDDPRLFTLTALRRRGIPPEAINLFCSRIGVTGSQTVLDPSMLDSCVREVLNVMATRVMAVLDPVKVVIANQSKERVNITVPNIPNDEKAGSHTVPFGDVIYIERSDFREKSDKSYKRLAVDQSVGLRHAGKVITVTNVVKGGNGEIEEIHATCKDVSPTNKPKAFIHWVCDPLPCEVRIYSKLFKHPNPEDPKEVPGGFLSDINEASLKVITNALVDTSVRDAPVESKYQFERTGFFAVDRDSTKTKFVFNQTIALKEDALKH